MVCKFSGLLFRLEQYLRASFYRILCCLAFSINAVSRLDCMRSSLSLNLYFTVRPYGFLLAENMLPLVVQVAWPSAAISILHHSILSLLILLPSLGSLMTLLYFNLLCTMHGFQPSRLDLVLPSAGATRAFYA